MSSPDTRHSTTVAPPPLRIPPPPIPLLPLERAPPAVASPPSNTPTSPVAAATRSTHRSWA
eukprot:scaffold196499_cov29-Tisochrysis_lutea.AAC.3